MSIYVEAIGIEEYKAAEHSRVSYPNADEVHSLFMRNDAKGPEAPEALRFYARVDYPRNRLAELAINVTLLDRDLQPAHPTPFGSRLENGFWIPDEVLKTTGKTIACEVRSGFFLPHETDTQQEIDYIASRDFKESVPVEYH